MHCKVHRDAYDESAASSEEFAASSTGASFFAGRPRPRLPAFAAGLGDAFFAGLAFTVPFGLPRPRLAGGGPSLLSAFASSFVAAGASVFLGLPRPRFSESAMLVSEVCEIHSDTKTQIW